MFVEDLETARRFYRETFGLPVVFEDESSATLVYGLLLPDGRLRYFNAGHPRPIVLRASSELETLRTTAPLLNPLLPRGEGEVEELRLLPGERLFAFTDGVYEVLRVVEGRSIDGERHFQRLSRSLAELELPNPADTGIDLPAIGRLLPAFDQPELDEPVDGPGRGRRGHAQTGGQLGHPEVAGGDDEIERLGLGHRQLDGVQLRGVRRHQAVHERIEAVDDPVEVSRSGGTMRRGHEMLW